MEWKECKNLIVSDLSRLTNISKREGIKSLLFNASFRITFWFRIGSFLITRHHFIAKFCLMCVQLIHKHNQYLTGIQIGFGTKIGKALMFPHYSCISYQWCSNNWRQLYYLPWCHNWQYTRT